MISVYGERQFVSKMVTEVKFLSSNPEKNPSLIAISKLRFFQMGVAESRRQSPVQGADAPE